MNYATIVCVLQSAIIESVNELIEELDARSVERVDNTSDVMFLLIFEEGCHGV